MHVRTLLTLLALTCVTLAGCSGGGGGGKDEDDPTAGLGLQATDTTGVIRGVVVDEAIIPVPGVVVTLLSNGQTSESNELGAFGFEGLEPGSYFLSASKPGFKPVQQSTDVEAGVEDPRVVRVMLIADPTSKPTYEVFHFQGFLECNVAIPLFFFPCTNPATGEPIGSDNFEAQYPLSGNASFLHVSLLWDATQPVGTELYFNVCDVDTFCDSLEDIQEASGGKSPLTADLNATMLDEINASSGVGLQVSGNGEMGLAGANLKQGFDAYVVVFYGFEPPEGYNFVDDGEPKVPGQDA